MRGSVGGVTTGNSWLGNNPELAYPDGHENMSDSELMNAITITDECECENLGSECSSCEVES